MVCARTDQQVMEAYLFSFKSTEKFERKQAQKFLLSHVIVTFNEGQGHSYWY